MRLNSSIVSGRRMYHVMWGTFSSMILAMAVAQLPPPMIAILSPTFSSVMGTDLTVLLPKNSDNAMTFRKKKNPFGCCDWYAVAIEYFAIALIPVNYFYYSLFHLFGIVEARTAIACLHACAVVLIHKCAIFIEVLAERL